MKDHRRRFGIVPEVADLVGAVAVVGVHRHEPDLVGGKDRLEVLGPVKEELGEPVLFGDAEGQQPRGDAVGSPVEVAKRRGVRALALRDRLGHMVGDRLVDRCELPAAHVDPRG